VCLGFCGGGSGAYVRWKDQIPPDVDLALICYPGREGRYIEGFVRTWEELAADTVNLVLSASDRPYVLFGHSMGGWMAFDVTTQVELMGLRPPEALIVSSCNAPTGGLTERDRFPLAQDGDADLLRWMRTAGALADHALADVELRAMALELMRADIAVRDTYRPGPRTQVEVPLQVLRGAEDPVIGDAAPEEWRAATTGQFRMDTLPGGHFYTPEVWQRLPRYFVALETMSGGRR
jgi:surfactin synthase thioesterase subunit